MTREATTYKTVAEAILYEAAARLKAGLKDGYLNDSTHLQCAIEILSDLAERERQ